MGNILKSQPLWRKILLGTAMSLTGLFLAGQLIVAPLGDEKKKIFKQLDISEEKAREIAGGRVEILRPDRLYSPIFAATQPWYIDDLREYIDDLREYIDDLRERYNNYASGNVNVYNTRKAFVRSLRQIFPCVITVGQIEVPPEFVLQATNLAHISRWPGERIDLSRLVVLHELKHCNQPDFYQEAELDADMAALSDADITEEDRKAFIYVRSLNLLMTSAFMAALDTDKTPEAFGKTIGPGMGRADSLVLANRFLDGKPIKFFDDQMNTVSVLMLVQEDLTKALDKDPAFKSRLETKMLYTSDVEKLDALIVQVVRNILDSDDPRLAALPDARRFLELSMTAYQYFTTPANGAKTASVTASQPGGIAPL